MNERINPFAPPKLPPSAKKQDRLPVWAEEVDHDPFAPTVMGSAQSAVESMDDIWGKAAMRYMSPYAQGAATIAGIDKLLPMIIEEAVRMGKSGATLPGDVFTGKTDPKSDEAIARGLDVVGMMGGATMGMGPSGGLGAMGAKAGKPKNTFTLGQMAEAYGQAGTEQHRLLKEALEKKGWDVNAAIVHLKANKHTAISAEELQAVDDAVDLGFTLIDNGVEFTPPLKPAKTKGTPLEELSDAEYDEAFGVPGGSRNYDAELEDIEFMDLGEFTDSVPTPSATMADFEFATFKNASKSDINDAFIMLDNHNWDVPKTLAYLKASDPDAFGPVLQVVEQFAKKHGIDPESVNPYQVTKADDTLTTPIEKFKAMDFGDADPADIESAWMYMRQHGWNPQEALTVMGEKAATSSFAASALKGPYQVLSQYAKKHPPAATPEPISTSTKTTKPLHFTAWKAIKGQYASYGYNSSKEMLETIKDIGPGWEKVFDKFTPEQVKQVNDYIAQGPLAPTAPLQKPKIIPPDEWEKMSPEAKKAYDDEVEAWISSPGEPKWGDKTWHEMDSVAKNDLIAALHDPSYGGKEALEKFLKGSLGDHEYRQLTKPPDPKINISEQAKAAGYDLPVFHGTGRYNTPDFEEFNPLLGDGMHVGTYKAAHDILRGNFQQGARIMPLLAKIKNPLHLAVDMGAWRDPGRWVEKLSHSDDWGAPPPGVDVLEIKTRFGDRRRVWPNEEGKKLPREHWKRLMETALPLQHTGIRGDQFIPLLRDTLKELGYDGIAYVNNVEDKGSISYMLFDPAQVKVPWARRFDPTDPRVIEAGGFPIITIETDNEEPEWGDEVETPFGMAVEVEEEPEW